jgi:hypothetical protein
MTSRTCKILLLIALLPATALAQVIDRPIRGAFPIVTAGEWLWCGTPHGLGQFDTDQQEWSWTTVREGLPDLSITVLASHDDYLWVGTPDGVGRASAGLGDWVAYDTTDGLSDNQALSLAFSADYAWLGTPRGLNRYDIYVEAWSPYPVDIPGWPDSLPIYDLMAYGDTLWLATPQGILELDVNYETWREHRPLGGIGYHTILAANEFLWFLSDAGWARFEPSVRAWQTYTGSEIRNRSIIDVATEGDSIWVVTDHGVIIYVHSLDSWLPFAEERNLPSRTVNGIHLTRDAVYFATDAGVARYDRESRAWRTYTKSDGLLEDQVERVTVYGTFLVALGPHGVSTYDRQEERWRTALYPTPPRVSGLRKILTFDEKGPVLSLAPSHTSRLAGRATYRYEWEGSKSEGEELESSSNPHGRYDLQLVSQIGEGRNLVAFYDYDETKPEEEEKGATYRGRPTDYLREAAVGDIRMETFRSKLLGSSDLYGASGRFQAYGQQPATGRPRVGLSVWEGKTTSGPGVDFFRGTTESHRVTILDIDYASRTYFQIDPDGAMLPLARGSESVYVDDLNPATNDLNTIEDTVLAGWQGDYDILHPLADYTIEYDTGLLVLNQSVGEQSLLVIHVRSENGDEVIRTLHEPTGMSTQQVNRYRLGAYHIEPFEFSLTITDTLGNQIPLDQFGLDSDGDGEVDFRHIDFERGVLVFPSSRPFPEQVYSAIDPLHVYTLEVEYQAEVSLYQLSHRRIVENTEMVLLDGEPLRRGSDYVLDRTSGILNILGEGVVNEESEIEVTYEYETERDRDLVMAQGVYNPGEESHIAIGYQNLSDSTDTHLGDLAGELIWRNTPLGMDLRMIPEVAYGDDNQSASRFELYASSSRLRMYGSALRLNAALPSPTTWETRYGELAYRYRWQVTYEPVQWLPLDISWRRERSRRIADDTLRAGGTEEAFGGGILLNHPDFPSLSLRSTQTDVDAPDEDVRKRTITARGVYRVPEPMLRRIHLKSLSFRSQWKWQRTTPEQTTDQESTIQFGLLGMDLSPINQLNMSSSLREEWVREGDGLKQKTGRFELNLSCYRITGMEIDLRYRGEHEDQYPGLQANWRLSSRSRDWFTNWVISPGTWVTPLSPFTIELRQSVLWEGHQQGGSGLPSVSEAYWEQEERDKLDKGSDLVSRRIRLEYQPQQFVLIGSGYERTNTVQWDRQSEQMSIKHRWSGDVELRTMGGSLVRGWGERTREERGEWWAHLRDNLTGYWEHPWIRPLKGRLGFSYARQSEDEGEKHTWTSSYKPSLRLTYPMGSRGSWRRSELVADMSVALVHSQELTGRASSREYGIDVELDWWPTGYFSAEVEGGFTYAQTIEGAEPDLLTTSASLRLSARF